MCQYGGCGVYERRRRVQVNIASTNDTFHLQGHSRRTFCLLRTSSEYGNIDWFIVLAEPD